MMTRIRLFAGVAVAASSISCAWVSADPGSEQVQLVSAEQASACKKIGSASATTKDTVLLFSRSEKTMDEELLTLARNEAAKLGGDSLVAVGEPEEGQQAFEVYRCR